MKEVCTNIYADNYDELVEMILDDYDALNKRVEYPEITIVASNYEEAKKIVKYLVFNDLDIVSADIHSPKFSGYDKEYYVMINWEGVFVQPAIYNKALGYIKDASDYCYISNDANSSILKSIEYKKCFAFEIKDDKEVKCECACSNDNYTNCDGSTKVEVNGKEVFGKEAEEVIEKTTRDINKMIDAYREHMLSFDIMRNLFY